MSLGWAHRNSTNVGGWNDSGETSLLLFVYVFSCLCASITSSGMSFLSGLLSLPFVANSKDASPAWYLIPVWCMTLKSKSENRTPHRASRRVEFAKLRIHFSPALSVRIVSQWPSQYSRKRKRVHTIDLHWVMSHRFSPLARE